MIGDDRVKALKAKHKSPNEILNQLGYRHRRLLKNVPGGIYECNSRCSCHKQTCSNRVVQNGIIAQLQVERTLRLSSMDEIDFRPTSSSKPSDEVGVFEHYTIFPSAHSSVFIRAKFSPVNKRMNEANYSEMNIKQIWIFSK